MFSVTLRKLGKLQMFAFKPILQVHDIGYIVHRDENGEWVYHVVKRGFKNGLLFHYKTDYDLWKALRGKSVYTSALVIDDTFILYKKKGERA